MCKKITKSILVLILLSSSAFAQSVGRLMESIKNYDYYHTKVYAHKMLRNKKKLSAAAYALAYVYYQNYQPFHNIDSADKYIHLAVLNYPHQPFVSKYGTIDSAKIYSLYDSIALCQFKDINYQVFPKIYDLFLSRHPFVSKSLREKIKQHQYQKIIEYIQNVNKSDTTFHYITSYPEHPKMSLLYEIFDNQIFSEMTKHQTAAEYLLFLRNYPKNINREMALQNLLNIYINEKNTAGLKAFADEFSKDRYYAEQAWKWLFAYSVKKFNNEELEKFMQEYPDFPFKQEILEEMEMNAKILIPFADTTGSVGFIDTSGTFVIPPVYDAVSPFRENISAVFKNDSVFFINKNHQKIISKTFKDAYPFFNAYAPVFDGKNWFFINRLGVKQSDYFDWISEISGDNNYVFKKNNLYGLCDYKGQIIIPPYFEKLGDFDNHKTYYVENNLYGIIWDNGKKYPAVYQWISGFINDIAIVKQNNLYGIVNADNEMVLNNEYDLIFYCGDEIYLVVKNKKYGFFNIRERCFVYSFNWDYSKNTDVKYYTNGHYFKLILQNKVFAGDENGIILNKKAYQDLLVFKDIILFKQKNKWGILNKSFNAKNIVLYDNIIVCENKTIIVQKSNEYLIIDQHENVKYKTQNPISYITKKYYYEETENNGGIIIDVDGKIILSNVDSYQIFDKYIIAITKGKVKVFNSITL